MTHMKKWLVKLYERALASGFEGVETFYSSKETRQMKLYEGLIEHFEVSTDGGLCFKGLYEGYEGFAYTSVYDDDSIRELLDQTKEHALSAEMISKTEAESGDIHEKFYSLRCPSIGSYDSATLKKQLNTLEQSLSMRDSRIKKVSPCCVTEVTEINFLTDQSGKTSMERHKWRSLELGLVASAAEGEAMVNASGHCYLTNLEESYEADLIEQIHQDGIRLLNSTSHVGEQKEILLRGSAFADLLAGFSSVFGADKVQNQLSCLNGLEGKPIASKALVLMEVPMLKGGPRYRRFDDEGIPTQKKVIIRDGTLKTFLYDQETAKKVSMISTGNGFRQDHKSTVSVASTHLVIQKGKASFEELSVALRDGVCITAFHGLHAGINPVSGDFSLSCEGYFLEDGKPKQGIAGVTLSGNLLSLFRDVHATANDTWISSPYMPFVQTPSVVATGLTLSGTQ